MGPLLMARREGQGTVSHAGGGTAGECVHTKLESWGLPSMPGLLQHHFLQGLHILFTGFHNQNSKAMPQSETVKPNEELRRSHVQSPRTTQSQASREASEIYHQHECGVSMAPTPNGEFSV